MSLLCLMRGFFDFPKPVQLIRQLVEQGTDRDDIVLDFFAGSGTTGEATLKQNSSDGGNRRYILIQIPEPLRPENRDQKTAADYCDAINKPRNIAEPYHGETSAVQRRDQG